MCKDTVSIVRKKASANVYNLFIKMFNSGNEMYKLIVLENIKAHAIMARYSYR